MYIKKEAPFDAARSRGEIHESGRPLCRWCGGSCTAQKRAWCCDACRQKGYIHLGWGDPFKIWEKNDKVSDKQMKFIKSLASDCDYDRWEDALEAYHRVLTGSLDRKWDKKKASSLIRFLLKQRYLAPALNGI